VVNRSAWSWLVIISEVPFYGFLLFCDWNVSTSLCIEVQRALNLSGINLYWYLLSAPPQSVPFCFRDLEKISSAEVKK
jgi:hypothetical protein